MKYNIVINPGDGDTIIDCNPMIGVNPDGEPPEPLTPSPTNSHESEAEAQTEIETPQQHVSNVKHEMSVFSIFPLADAGLFLYIFLDTRVTGWVAMSMVCILSSKVLELYMPVNLIIITQLISVGEYGFILLMHIVSLLLVGVHLCYKYSL